MLIIILVATLCLAYANGANDNFKGVATLFGSGTTNYRSALTWATVTTLLGSLTAVLLAASLLKSFTGKGLVDLELASSADYGAAVALGAGLTVLLATRVGMPISTTHSLIGALIGAGWAASSTINYQKLMSGFLTPLLISPFLAIAATAVCYLVLSNIRRRTSITSETCLCVGTEVLETVPAGCDAVAMERAERLSVEVGKSVSCQSRYQGRLLGVNAATVLDKLHFLSSGIVSFARGLNDTPKIAALLLLAPAISSFGATALIGAAIALGGIISARRVAETMSHEITAMNHGQGFTSNLITGVIVIGASRFGLPVSTTHVSCGSLFGIGSVTGQARWKMMGKILGAWLLTLPIGALIGGLCYLGISGF